MPDDDFEMLTLRGQRIRIYQMLKELQMSVQDIQTAMNDLVTQVTSETTVIQSAITLLGGIKSQLDVLAADESLAPAVQQKISDLSSTLQANSDALSQAVAANTPAALKK